MTHTPDNNKSEVSNADYTVIPSILFSDLDDYHSLIMEIPPKDKCSNKIITVPESQLQAQERLLNIAEFPTDKLISLLTRLLARIIESNDQSLHTRIEPKTKINKNTKLLDYILSFHGKHIPSITLKQYFQRIQRYCPTTNDVFVSILVYFSRIARKCNLEKQVFIMNSYNIHRLIIVAITISTKFFSDYFYSNLRYSRVGGISLQELNHLELQFLILCDFKLLIDVQEMQKYANLLYTFGNKELG